MAPDRVAERLEAVEVVLFDLDGTLVDTLGLILESMRHATGKVLGAPLPDDTLMRDVGVPLTVQMRAFSEEHADELVAVYREHNARVHDALIREYPGTELALERLSSSGYRLGVVTSKMKSVAQRGLERFSLGRFFEVFVASDDTDAHKPEPDPILLAASRLGVSPTRCAYVGDSEFDVAAANAAGAVSVAALWGAGKPEVVLAQNPDYVVHAILEVAALFDGHERGFRARLGE